MALRTRNQLWFWPIRIFVLLVLVGSFSSISAQNLAPNPSFETFTFCPVNYNIGGPLQCTPWIPATAGTSDYFNSCSNPSNAGVPDNFFGSQLANTGEAYTGGYTLYNLFVYREYILAPLTQPLIAGHAYYVSFYTSLADQYCGIQTIGALFTVNPPPSNGSGPLDNFTPQVESNIGFISDDEVWTLIEGCFIAEGGEAYITIGNFHDDFNTPLDPDCDIFSGISYYYYDDILVVETTSEAIDFDLGEPVEACDFYEIDPGLSGVNYFWDDGSHGPTLTVTTSGTYSLTVAAGCDYGSDSIEVVINNPPPVDLNPDQITICNGDSYNISLDPDYGDYEWNDGSSDPNYSITTAGVYAVTLDDGCDITDDEITVMVMDIPDPFTLGEDTYICPGQEIEYYFDPDLGDFQWQDNNHSNSYLIYQEGVYTLTISNMCGEQTDEVEITAVNPPDINIGPDQELLCNGEFIDIELDPDQAEYIWQDGSTQPFYHITTTGLYSVTATNVCGTDIDQLNVISLDEPVFNLGNDLDPCFGDTVVFAITGVIGDFYWNNGSTSNSLSVTSSGIYSLTITNDCGVAFDSVSVNFSTPIQPPDLGPDFSLCPGEQQVVYAGNSNVNYVWQDLSTADSFLIANAGSYFVEVSNGCSSYSDTVNVVINDNPPQIDLVSTVSLCQGQSITLDAGIGGVSFLWNDGSQNSQLQVTTPGQYSLTVSNTCGADADTVLVSDGGPAPFISLGSDIDLCPGDNVLLSPSSSDVIGWLWQDGSGLTTFNVSSAGQISIQVSNACGSAYDTLLVSLLPPTPTLILGADTSICPGESLLLIIGIPNVQILWMDGSSDPDFDVLAGGLISASIADVCGTTVDTIAVNILPDAPLLNLGPDQSLCPGEVITLSPGISGVNYVWQDGSTNTTYQSTQQEMVILTVSNDCGFSTDTLVITENSNGPVIDLGQDVLACEGETITIESNISGVNYLWQDGSTTSDYITSTSGIFILEVSNLCGTDVDTIEVDIHGVVPSPDLGADTSLCEGISLLLTSSADPETIVEWQNGSVGSTFTVTSPGLYTLHESNHCGEATDSILVAYLDAPDNFTLGPDTILCPGESIILSAPTSAYTILWQNGSNQNSIVADQAGVYSLVLSNSCGSVTDNLSIDFDTRVPQLDIDPIPWCEGDIISIDATQPFAAQYHWSNGAISPVIQVSQPGLYSIDIITPCSTLSQDVDVIPGSNCVHFNDIYIPTVFSPNSDNINDLFTISFGTDLEITSVDGSIFDRWGNLVFSSDAIPFVWDGRFDEELMLPGVYVYTFRVKYLDRGLEREEIFTGDVTLIR